MFAAELAAGTAMLGSLLASTSGILTTLATYAWNNIALLEFSDLHQAWISRKEDFICAMFEATSAADARSRVNIAT